MQPFRIRCSCIGKIMTASRKKSDPLSETCKSYLKEWIITERYGREKNIQSKYLEKGIAVEDQGITLLTEFMAEQ